MLPATLDDVDAEFEALEDWDDRYRLLIDLGRALPPMDNALKTEATRVRGCASQVWLYPTRDGERLHFAADSDAAIVKGLVALVLLGVQDRRRCRDRRRRGQGAPRRPRPRPASVVEPDAGPRVDAVANQRVG